MKVKVADRERENEVLRERARRILAKFIEKDLSNDSLDYIVDYIRNGAGQYEVVYRAEGNVEGEVDGWEVRI